MTGRISTCQACHTDQRSQDSHSHNNTSNHTTHAKTALLATAVVFVAVASALAFTTTADHHHAYDAFAEPTHRQIYEWGSYGIGVGGMFVHPQFADVDHNGNVYVTDLGNRMVQKFDSQGTFVTSWGTSGHADGQFRYPSGIATDGAYIYVADRDLNRIQKFDLDGNYISQWGERGIAEGSMSKPNGIAVSMDGMHVYVADTGNYRIQKFTTDGDLVLSFGESGMEPGKFVTPYDIEVAGDGTLYVSDKANKRIDRYTVNGTYITSHAFDAPGSFEFIPEGIELSSDGTMIYVTNVHSKNVMYLNLSESSEPLGTIDRIGPFNYADMIFPTDVTFGINGQIYVVDSLGHSIHAFSTPEYIKPEITTKPDGTSHDGKNENGGQSHTAQQEPQTAPIDTTPPIVTAPPDITVDATGALTKVDIGQVSAVDPSGIKAILSNAPDRFPIGISKVTWIVFDNERNSAEAYQYVTVLACGQSRSAYDNVIAGTSYNNTINGTSKSDLIFGQDGKDIINGGDGNDCIFGEGSDDVIAGGDGSDYIIGGTGDDILRGEGGADIIYGGAGGDFLDGGEGDSDQCYQTDGFDLSVDCEYYFADRH